MMATGCSGKDFDSKFDKEMYYDMEFEEFCTNFEFAVSRILIFPYRDFVNPVFLFVHRMPTLVGFATGITVS